MEKKIICSDDELDRAHCDFCDTMFAAIDNRTSNVISPEEYDIILADADNEYNKIVYGE